MKIHIDGTDESGLKIQLDQEKLPIHSERSVIESLFGAEPHIEAKDISEIEVNEGPGFRFTGTRQSVVAANALAYALGVAVNGKPFVTPIYYKEPNITTSRKTKTT